MKTFAPLLCLALVACAGANQQAKSPAAQTSTSSAAVANEPVAAPEAPPAAPPAAPSAKPAPSGGDPLSMDGSIGALPEVVFTPKGELKRNGAADLNDAFALATKESAPEAAAAKLTKRLGKPTWVENGQKRVWVVGDTQQCHRLVLRADGSVDLDGAPRSEWQMLSTFARQNTCSGEIQKERED